MHLFRNVGLLDGLHYRLFVVSYHLKLSHSLGDGLTRIHSFHLGIALVVGLCFSSISRTRSRLCHALALLYPRARYGVLRGSGSWIRRLSFTGLYLHNTGVVGLRRVYAASLGVDVGEVRCCGVRVLYFE